MNRFAVDYSSDMTVRVQEIVSDTAIGHENNDLLEILSSCDQHYYSAPEVGQTAKLQFTAPEPVDGMTRTVFAKVSGYYDIHHSGTFAKQDSIINRINYEPGYFVSYSLEKYIEWEKATLAECGADHLR